MHNKELTMATKEEILAEAVKRMKQLDVYKPAIREFEEKGTVMVSERPLGALYYLNEEQKKDVEAFEKRHGYLVYMVVHTFTEFGELYDLLYVSSDKDEWEMDNTDLAEGYALSYCINKDSDMCSEFGSIGIANRGGGIIRTA